MYAFVHVGQTILTFAVHDGGILSDAEDTGETVMSKPVDAKHAAA